VGRADSFEVLDVGLLFGPIEAQHTGAADESIQVRSIERHVRAETFVVHDRTPFRGARYCEHCRLSV
jgi:hypothetical protein